MLNTEDLNKFSYVTTEIILENEDKTTYSIPCYEFLYRNYYSGINLCKKAESGDTVYTSIKSDLDLALQKLTIQQRKAFELNIMYDKPIANKYRYLIDEAKKRLQSFLATPEDIMYIMVKNNEE